MLVRDTQAQILAASVFFITQLCFPRKDATSCPCCLGSIAFLLGSSCPCVFSRFARRTHRDTHAYSDSDVHLRSFAHAISYALACNKSNANVIESIPGSCILPRALIFVFWMLILRFDWQRIHAGGYISISPLDADGVIFLNDLSYTAGKHSTAAEVCTYCRPCGEVDACCML